MKRSKVKWEISKINHLYEYVPSAASKRAECLWPSMKAWLIRCFKFPFFFHNQIKYCVRYGIYMAPISAMVTQNTRNALQAHTMAQGWVWTNGRLINGVRNFFFCFAICIIDISYVISQLKDVTPYWWRWSASWFNLPDSIWHPFA